MPAMFGSLGRRSVEATVLLFAVLGFTYVPLGEHTGLEHAKAIFATAPAREAAAELWQAAGRVRRTMFGQETPTPEPPPNALVVDAGAPDASQAWP